jgi:hypothetical protein
VPRQVRPVARAAAARAARRRRRVLGLLLLANLAVVAVAVGKVVAWPWLAVPAGLLVAWLVACRLMVRRERSTRAAAPGRTAPQPAVAPAAEPVAEQPAAEPEVSATADVAAARPDGWDPVPITLPTYVAKAPVGRTVRTIDLDATGVWSSGRSASDSALARQADEAARAAKTETEQRATGS